MKTDREIDAAVREVLADSSISISETIGRLFKEVKKISNKRSLNEPYVTLGAPGRQEGPEEGRLAVITFSWKGGEYFVGFSIYPKPPDSIVVYDSHNMNKITWLTETEDPHRAAGIIVDEADFMYQEILRVRSQGTRRVKKWKPGEALLKLFKRWNSKADDWGDTDLFDFVEYELLPVLKKYRTVPEVEDLFRYVDGNEDWDAGDIVGYVQEIMSGVSVKI